MMQSPKDATTMSLMILWMAVARRIARQQRQQSRAKNTGNSHQ
jgi:hypothetical protein